MVEASESERERERERLTEIDRKRGSARESERNRERERSVAESRMRQGMEEACCGLPYALQVSLVQGYLAQKNTHHP